MPTDNNLNGKTFLWLRRSDLLELFPDNFLTRKEVADFLEDLVGEILVHFILNLHSVYFQHPISQAQLCIVTVCFVKILSFFHLPEIRGLAAVTLAIGFTPGTCSYVPYKFFLNSCISLKIVVFDSSQRVPLKQIYLIFQSPKKKMEMCIVFIYMSSKVPYGAVTFSPIIESDLFLRKWPLGHKNFPSLQFRMILSNHMYCRQLLIHQFKMSG